MRLAFGRLACETNALSPLRTGVADFERVHLLAGDELLRACGPRERECVGFLRNAELSGFVQAVRRHPDVEAVPLTSAWTVPGGKLSQEAFVALKDRLVADLVAAGPVDGALLSLHGAMQAEHVDDAEAELLEAFRTVLGPGVPIAVTLDLHAHLTARMVAATDLVFGYQTNPHRDHARVGRRAGEVLIRTVRGEVRPACAWRALPMVLGGAPTLDFLAPMRGLFARLRRLERRGEALSASIFTCHLWNDAPDLGWAVHVLTDGDPDRAEALADELAEACWSVRHSLPPALPSPSEAVHSARRAWWARRLGVVCISDASDMVGAGAVGENTALLRAFLEDGEGMRCLATVRDDAVVEALWSEPDGAPVQLEVGGKLAPTLCAPLAVSGRVARRVRIEGLGRVVVLDLDHVQLVVTEAPPLAMRPSFYRSVGLHPARADVVMVKSLFPFRLYFAWLNRKTVYARSVGMTDFDVWRTLPTVGPVHPRDVVEHWSVERPM